VGSELDGRSWMGVGWTELDGSWMDGVGWELDEKNDEVG